MFENIDIGLIKKELRDQSKNYKQNFINIEQFIKNELKEILDLKKNSISSIQNISKNIASDIIEKISGDKLNESSIKAAVEDISKKNVGKYL